MSSADDVIVRLREAKEKLVAAKSRGLHAASIVARAKDSVGHALGRAGIGSSLLAQMATKEKTVVAQIMGIDALIKSVDVAIQQTRNVGQPGASGNTVGASGGP